MNALQLIEEAISEVNDDATLRVPISRIKRKNFTFLCTENHPCLHPCTVDNDHGQGGAVEYKQVLQRRQRR